MRISDWSSDVCSSDLFKLTGPFLQIPAIALGNAHFRRHEFFCELRQRHIGAGGIANADRELVSFLLMFEHFDILELQPGVLSPEVFAVSEHLNQPRRRSLEGLLLSLFHSRPLKKKPSGCPRRPT